MSIPSSSLLALPSNAHAISANRSSRRLSLLQTPPSTGAPSFINSQVSTLASAQTAVAPSPPSHSSSPPPPRERLPQTHLHDSRFPPPHPLHGPVLRGDGPVCLPIGLSAIHATASTPFTCRARPPASPVHRCRPPDPLLCAPSPLPRP